MGRRYGVMKKGLALSVDVDVRGLFERLSKAALMDGLIDAARRDAGNEDLDGTALHDAIVKTIAPVLRFRGDKVPR